MGKPFLMPWIGSDYAAVKVLEDGEQPLSSDALDGMWAYSCHVLGESHYGEPREHRPDFTHEVIHKCAFIRSNCSRFFAKVLEVVANKHISELNREQHWQKLAFSNFVQDLLPKSRKEPQSEEWERGAAAFASQLALTTPQVLVVLGHRLWKHLPRDFGFALPPMRLPQEMYPLPEKYGDREVSVEEAWAYVYESGGKKRVTIAVYVVHPSGRGFDWPIAARRVKTVRVFHSNIASSEEVANCEAKQIPS
jgi:hypothetical protein